MSGTASPQASGSPDLAPRPSPRPPLDRRTKVGAAIAGAVSFNLLNIGFVLFWLPILLGFISLLFTTIVRFVARIDRDPDPEFSQFARIVDSLNLEVWAVPLVLVSLLGVAVMVLSVFTSKWTLAARGIARPWAITWAGLGVATAANALIGGILSSGVNSATSFATQRSDYRGDVVAVIVVTTVISIVVSIAVNAAIGWLAMWWMAFVFRPADARTLSGGAGVENATAPVHPASALPGPDRGIRPSD